MLSRRVSRSLAPSTTLALRGLVGSRSNAASSLCCSALRFQNTASSSKSTSTTTGSSFSKPIASSKFADPDMTHFRATPTPHPLYEKPKDFDSHSQSIWSDEEMKSVEKTHVETKDLVDRVALLGVRVLRFGFDVVSGYFFGRLTKSKILRRILFLETAAGIPGMVAGSIRHLRSLRLMRRDRGWIHTLLEEAENERMHMLIFMHTYNPGLLFRASVLVTQGIFWNIFFFAYLFSPRLCHRFVGYLEEEAVRTYTHILEVMDSKDPRDSEVSAYGKQPATDLARHYWRLPATATMRDVILAVRRDEANHRDVNHAFAGVGVSDKCPFEEKGHKH